MSRHRLARKEIASEDYLDDYNDYDQRDWNEDVVDNDYHDYGPTKRSALGAAAVVISSVIPTATKSKKKGKKKSKNQNGNSRDDPPEELRLDDSDGNFYNLQSFIDVYGGSVSQPPHAWTSAEDSQTFCGLYKHENVEEPLRNGKHTESSGNIITPDNFEPDPEAIQMLTELGYEEAHVLNALKQALGDTGTALDLLIEPIPDDTQGYSGEQSDGGDVNRALPPLSELYIDSEAVKTKPVMPALPELSRLIPVGAGSSAGRKSGKTRELEIHTGDLPLLPSLNFTLTTRRKPCPRLSFPTNPRALSELAMLISNSSTSSFARNSVACGPAIDLSIGLKPQPVYDDESQGVQRVKSLEPLMPLLLPPLDAPAPNSANINVGVDAQRVKSLEPLMPLPALDTTSLEDIDQLGFSDGLPSLNSLGAGLILLPDLQSTVGSSLNAPLPLVGQELIPQTSANAVGDTGIQDDPSKSVASGSTTGILGSSLSSFFDAVQQPKSQARDSIEQPVVKQGHSAQSGIISSCNVSSKNGTKVSGFSKRPSMFGATLCAVARHRQHKLVKSLIPGCWTPNLKKSNLDRSKLFNFLTLSPDASVLAAQQETKLNSPLENAKKTVLEASMEYELQSNEILARVAKEQPSISNITEVFPDSTSVDDQISFKLGGEELRIDLSDGNPYPLSSFIEVYGGSTSDPPIEWLESAHTSTNTINKSPTILRCKVEAPISEAAQPVAPRSPTRQLSRERQVSKRKKFKGLDVLAEYESAKATRKVQLNLVILGHVDAGKSTLMGHLLNLLGNIDARQMRKYEKEATNDGKGSFKFAWVLDETEEERTRGVTVDIANAHFITERRHVTVLDAPGHRDYLANAITGAAMADAALLVVDSRAQEFESGFEGGGQTREHAILARSFGVQELVVAVNKMDAIGWSEGRFAEIREKMLPFCKSIGFKKAKVRYIPVSGFDGDNLVTAVSKDKAPWYKGPTLMQVLDEIEAPLRRVDASLRMCASNIYKSVNSASGGLAVVGSIFHGVVQVGETVLIAPNSVSALVKNIEIDSAAVPWAVAGDHVTLTVNGVAPEEVPISSILCSIEDPIEVHNRFIIQIVTFDLDIPITKGFSLLLHFQQRYEPVVVDKLICTVDKATNEPLKRKPRVLVSHTAAQVRITAQKKLCLELFEKSKPLGRVVLRYGQRTVAAGKVLERT